MISITAFVVLLSQFQFAFSADGCLQLNTFQAFAPLQVCIALLGKTNAYRLDSKFHKTDFGKQNDFRILVGGWNP